MGATDGRRYLAQRVVNVPIDIGAYGHYQTAPSTGTILAGFPNGGEILQFRWASTGQVAVLSVRCTGLYATTAFAAGPLTISMYTARDWTVDGSGGFAISLSGDNQKLNKNHSSSRVSARIAATASLSLGTKTLDSNPVGAITSHSSWGVSTATPLVGNVYLPELTLFDANIANGGSPLILNNEEGFVIRPVVPGTGVWTTGFEIKWAELPQTYER